MESFKPYFRLPSFCQYNFESQDRALRTSHHYYNKAIVNFSLGKDEILIE